MSVDEIASMRSRYKALRANYKKSIIDTKNKAWEYFCSTNSNNFGFTFKAAFRKLSIPTNLHQISTGDPASLFHKATTIFTGSKLITHNNLYNDYADFYAKQAVYDGEVFSVPAPRSFLSSSLNKFILESWNDCNTGLRVKRFFNNLKLNILPISKYLVHFLTNHGPFPAYLHRFNLLPSPNCLYGSPGDADHYVFHCPFTSDHHLVNPIPNALYPWVNSIINNRAIHNKLISCFAISKSICDNLA
ncbi:RNase H domain-containing protein [Trichonephila clavipes]|nr:RNase H domain-containing protein [Trichonephila clavipes]